MLGAFALMMVAYRLPVNLMGITMNRLFISLGKVSMCNSPGSRVLHRVTIVMSYLAPCQWVQFFSPVYYLCPSHIPGTHYVLLTSQVHIVIYIFCSFLCFDRSVYAATWSHICEFSGLGGPTVQATQQGCDCLKRKGTTIPPHLNTPSVTLTPSEQINQNIQFVRRSSLALTIKNWTRWFHLGTRLHIADGHKLVSDPVSELEKVSTLWFPSRERNISWGLKKA